MLLSFLYVFLVLMTITCALLLMMRWDKNTRLIENDRRQIRCESKKSKLWKFNQQKVRKGLFYWNLKLKISCLIRNLQNFRFRQTKNLSDSVLSIESGASFIKFCFMDILLFLFVFGLLPLFFIWLITRLLQNKQRKVLSSTRRRSTIVKSFKMKSRTKPTLIKEFHHFN